MTPEERKFWVGKMGARMEWWDRTPEAAIDPDREIVDAHFHLWDIRDFPDPQGDDHTLITSRYLLDEFLHDACGGHNVVECVYIESGSGALTSGPEFMRPVGETAFAAEMAGQLTATENSPDISAIVAHADLRHPGLCALLDAHMVAGRGRLRGIRQSGARLENPADRLLVGAAPAGLYADPAFRRGLAILGERGLTFDAFQFHFQLSELAELIRAVPQTIFIVNHLGCPLGFNRAHLDDDPIFPVWADGVNALADLPNTVIKLGGIASIVTGYDRHAGEKPPTSQEFVADRGRYFHHAIRRFGAERAMFESNFPVDSLSISYRNLWNAYKIMAAEYDALSQHALLAGTARKIYRFGTDSGF